MCGAACFAQDESSQAGQGQGSRSSEASPPHQQCKPAHRLPWILLQCIVRTPENTGHLNSSLWQQGAATAELCTWATPTRASVCTHSEQASLERDFWQEEMAENTKVDGLTIAGKSNLSFFLWSLLSNKPPCSATPWQKSWPMQELCTHNKRQIQNAKTDQGFWPKAVNVDCDVRQLNRRRRVPALGGHSLADCGKWPQMVKSVPVGALCSAHRTFNLNLEPGRFHHVVLWRAPLWCY